MLNAMQGGFLAADLSLVVSPGQLLSKSHLLAEDDAGSAPPVLLGERVS